MDVAMAHGDRRGDSTDALLVTARSLSPTAAAVERAYADHYVSVYRYALALTRSHADAEDISSEVFARALRAWDEAPPRPLPWLLLTARRISTDRVRRATRLVSVLGRMRAQSPADAGERRTEFWARFRAVGEVLAHRQR